MKKKTHSILYFSFYMSTRANIYAYFSLYHPEKTYLAIITCAKDFEAIYYYYTV